MEPDKRNAWTARLGVVGRAQARYLWLLLVTGLFYLAVHSRIALGEPGTGDELVIPLVNLTLSAVPVWASGPAVLSTLLLALHGTLRAYKTAGKALFRSTNSVSVRSTTSLRMP